jgi:hypothetical protein
MGDLRPTFGARSSAASNQKGTFCTVGSRQEYEQRVYLLIPTSTYRNKLDALIYGTQICQRRRTPLFLHPTSERINCAADREYVRRWEARRTCQCSLQFLHAVFFLGGPFYVIMSEFPIIAFSFLLLTQKRAFTYRPTFLDLSETNLSILPPGVPVRFRCRCRYLYSYFPAW